MTPQLLFIHYEVPSTASESAQGKYIDYSNNKNQDDMKLESIGAYDNGCMYTQRAYERAGPAEVKASISILNASKTEEYDNTSLITEKPCGISSYHGQAEESNLQWKFKLTSEKGSKPRGECYFNLKDSSSPRAVLDHAEEAVSLISSSRMAYSNFHSTTESRTTNSNPAIAATTVFDGVRRKVQELKDRIAQQEAEISELRVENKNLNRVRDEHMQM